jgi:hypothetical protein
MKVNHKRMALFGELERFKEAPGALGRKGLPHERRF